MLSWHENSFAAISGRLLWQQRRIGAPKDKIYILEIDGKLVGSVAIYDNEIDDLIVGKSYQRAGYGEALLQFAISHMQSNNISPIVLHVADWNQGAIKMYIKNGFAIVKTEETWFWAIVQIFCRAVIHVG